MSIPVGTKWLVTGDDSHWRKRIARVLDETLETVSIIEMNRQFKLSRETGLEIGESDWPWPHIPYAPCEEKEALFIHDKFRKTLIRIGASKTYILDYDSVL